MSKGDLLKEFETATHEVARLEMLLQHARARVERLRKTLAVAIGEPATEQDASAGIAQVVDVVRRTYGAVTASDVAGVLEISLDAARLRLQRAARQGLIYRIRHGLYAKPPPRSGGEIPDDPED